MTVIFGAYTLLSAVALVLAVSWFRRLLIPVVLVVFAAGFYVTAMSVNYVGYALDSFLVPDDKEALVLYSNEGQDYVYYVLLFSGEDRPRLVRFPATEATKEESKKASDGLKIIRFGKKKTSQGAGGSEGMDSGEAPPFTFITPGESKMMQKEQG